MYPKLAQPFGLWIPGKSKLLTFTLGSIIYADDFSGTAGALGGKTPTVGSNLWVTQTGTPTIDGSGFAINNAVSGAAPLTCGATIDTTATNVRITLTGVTWTTQATGKHGILFNYVDINNWYTIRFGNTAIELTRAVAGVTTILSTFNATPTPPVNISVDLFGDTIQVNYNGQVAITFTETNRIGKSSTLHGVRFITANSTTNKIDGWEVRTIS